MPAQKGKINLPLKLCIGLIYDNASSSKKSKMDNTKTMLHKLATHNLRLKEYVRIYATIHFQTGKKSNIMRDPMVVTILTQYHISKLLKAFRELVVTVVLN